MGHRKFIKYLINLRWPPQAHRKCIKCLMDLRWACGGHSWTLAAGSANGYRMARNVGKCELVLPAETTTCNLPALFPHRLLMNPETNESRVLTKGNFELLGAAIGDNTFCESYMESRVGKCDKLLGELKTM